MDGHIHPTVHMGVIIYPRPNPDSGLANLLWKNEPRGPHQYRDPVLPV